MAIQAETNMRVAHVEQSNDGGQFSQPPRIGLGASEWQEFVVVGRSKCGTSVYIPAALSSASRCQSGKRKVLGNE